MIEIVDANDLDNLKRQLSYTFLDAYGNFDGADILFDSIVKATEERIIKLLEDECSSDWPKVIEMTLSNLIALIRGEQK